MIIKIKRTKKHEEANGITGKSISILYFDLLLVHIGYHIKKKKRLSKETVKKHGRNILPLYLRKEYSEIECYASSKTWGQQPQRCNVIHSLKWDIIQLKKCDVCSLKCEAIQSHKYDVIYFLKCDAIQQQKCDVLHPLEWDATKSKKCDYIFWNVMPYTHWYVIIYTL